LSFYIDTSALVPALVTEAGTPRVMAWLRGQTPGSIFISDWTHTEIASALSLKVRTREITLELRADARTTWSQLHSANLPTLAVLPEHFETAARFASQHNLGLRAGDALHLAIATAGGHTLVTLDRQMAEAASELGIPVEPL
jgi:hypothetical protein